ncbi:MAG TPA: helix-turn-helix transcriptional regulator [Chitinophaga sp.]|uniref:helix-turn-helix domain-containing protein n=1 Tax=Chitinophaga sp. TaxID=1869181 RepID=UPI002B6AD816|nr:helix-turn-helix transcriptional regulator [Chitinophaga sp.]HVI43606.1 helix-turn-helix transcriptional regulator [Chitinophaga sp.]
MNYKNSEGRYTVSRFIKIIRTEMGLKQEQIADTLGIKKSTYATYEDGKSPGSAEFHEQFLQLTGIYLRHSDEADRIIFVDKSKLPPHVVEYLINKEFPGKT